MVVAGSPPGKALHGVKVLDLTQFEAGTSVTQALAWYGADVVKIEEPRHGDQGRLIATEQGVVSYYFILLNSNKRSVTLNLRDERGKQMLRQMIPRADIFIENFAPGTIERLGFSYEEVSALNPRIVYAQIKGFGADSPFANYLAFDYIGHAVGGSMAITGTQKGPPLRPGSNLGDTGTGLHCLAGILAALLQRFETGRGQRIEVAMQEAVLSFCRIAYAAQADLGHTPPRVGNRDLLMPSVPSNLYPCRPFGENDYCCVHIPATENHLWERLLRAIGREDLRPDARFGTPESRQQHAAEVDAVIAEWARRHTKYEAMAILAETGVPAAAVQDTMELTSDPYLRKRGSFVIVQHPVRGDVIVPGWPVKMSRSPVEVVRAPLLGEHNVEVYGEWLGLDERQVAQLREDKVI